MFLYLSRLVLVKNLLSFSFSSRLLRLNPYHITPAAVAEAKVIGKPTVNNVKVEAETAIPVLTPKAERKEVHSPD